MNAQATSDMIVPSSPTSSRTRRAFRRAAGRSGGIFERVPGSGNPYQFRYVKPEGQPRSPEQHPTCNEPPTTTTIDTPSVDYSIVETPVSETQASSSLYTLDADTTSASSVREAASSSELANAERSDTNSIASSALSEYTIASHESRQNTMRRSMGNLRGRLRDSAVGTSIEQLRQRCAEHKFRKQVPRRIGRGGTPETGEVPPGDVRTNRRARVSKFIEELGDDGTESTVGLLGESEKATWRFFRSERKTA